MDKHKAQLQDFLQGIGYNNTEELLSKLEAYQQALFNVNQIVNLVSRKMPIEWYWTHHFLDSLILLKSIDLSGKTVLDFGTGGGIPGIPLYLAVPEMKLILLDATGRKIDALKQILTDLHLPLKMAVCARLEDYAVFSGRTDFDYIICRAVALEPRYVKPLQSLLKPGGKIVFFKAQEIDDIAHLPYKVECEMQLETPGYRRIISIARKDLK